MIILLSPSKTQEAGRPQRHSTQPLLISRAGPLVARLQQLSTAEIAELMAISETLAEQTRQRFREFRLPPDPAHCTPALLLFRGDVFAEIDVESYAAEDFLFAQKHLRILSGLYGLLRPLDLVQPHRLEMGGKFRTGEGQTLYQYWRHEVERALNGLAEENGEREFLNLASQEYFKVVRPQKLAGSVITASFKEEKNGAYRTVAIHAKRARGAMCDYIVRNRLTTPEQLTGFSYNGYTFAADLSTDDELVYLKEGT